MTTEEGNRLIIESPFVSDIHKNWMLKAKEAGEDFYTNNLLHSLRYHSSWDWLLPAWSKLYKLFLQIPRTEERQWNDAHNFVDNFSITVNYNDTETGFQIMTEALQWYNTNNLTTKQD